MCSPVHTQGSHRLCLADMCFVDCEEIRESRESTVLIRIIIVKRHDVFYVVEFVSTAFRLPIAKMNLAFKVFKYFY